MHLLLKARAWAQSQLDRTLPKSWGFNGQESYVNLLAVSAASHGMFLKNSRLQRPQVECST
jgi:hypothetical protein